jgi:hypothetical protein
MTRTVERTAAAANPERTHFELDLNVRLMSDSLR